MKGSPLENDFTEEMVGILSESSIAENRVEKFVGKLRILCGFYEVS